MVFSFLVSVAFSGLMVKHPNYFAESKEECQKELVWNVLLASEPSVLEILPGPSGADRCGSKRGVLEDEFKSPFLWEVTRATARASIEVQPSTKGLVRFRVRYLGSDFEGWLRVAQYRDEGGWFCFLNFAKDPSLMAKYNKLVRDYPDEDSYWSDRKVMGVPRCPYGAIRAGVFGLGNEDFPIAKLTNMSSGKEVMGYWEGQGACAILGKVN